LKIAISNKDIKGFVFYGELDKTVDVTLPDPTSELIVEEYFTRLHEFRIPESSRIDDYRIDKIKPIESEMYMRLALSTLHAETGFWVHWETMEN
jgi:hypothetical protein